MQALHLVWSALWRVQVTHWAVFVVVPAVAAITRLALGLALVPFVLVGLGNRSTDVAAELLHLRSPTCWVALAPCGFGDITLFSRSETEAPKSATTPAAPEAEPFLPIPTGFTLRHGWFVLWLVWFLLFLLRRKYKTGAA